MKKIITHGIKDSEFIRGEVPMTKEEVRIISISKLELTENSLFYDIGSGTGSIAIESATLSTSLKVFAIETNPVAVDLIRQNKEKFNKKTLDR